MRQLASSLRRLKSFKMRNRSCIFISVVVSVVWVLAMVAYIGKLDAQNGQTSAARRAKFNWQRRDEQKKQPKQDPDLFGEKIAPPPADIPALDSSEIAGQIHEEQFSLNQIPDVDLDKLAVINSKAEQASQLTALKNSKFLLAKYFFCLITLLLIVFIIRRYRKYPSAI